MSPGTKAKIAFAAAGVAVMAMAGGAVFAHTYALAPTFIAMLAAAVALATVGRRAARAFWGKSIYGIDDPYGEETRSYKKTTRGRHLAPKLLRLVRKAKAPVTIMVVGDEHLPGQDGRCAWSVALHQAATAGATVLLYIREVPDEGEAERAHAFAESHSHCRAIRIGRTPHGTFMRCRRSLPGWGIEATPPTHCCGSRAPARRRRRRRTRSTATHATSQRTSACSTSTPSWSMDRRHGAHGRPPPDGRLASSPYGGGPAPVSDPSAPRPSTPSCRHRARSAGKRTSGCAIRTPPPAPASGTPRTPNGASGRHAWTAGRASARR